MTDMAEPRKLYVFQDDPDVIAALDAFAAARGLTRSALIRTLIRGALSVPNTCTDASKLPTRKRRPARPTA